VKCDVLHVHLDHVELHSSELFVVLDLVGKFGLTQGLNTLGDVAQSADCKCLLKHLNIEKLFGLVTLTFDAHQILALSDIFERIG
jgi:hypothetical protein